MANDLDALPLSRVERAAAFFTLTDPGVLIDCHSAKRQEVVHEFLMLCVMGLLFLVVWTTTMTAVSIKWWQAFPVSALVVALILLFDVRLTVSDTDPRGILRNGPPPRSFYGRIAARFLISLLLNTGTAVGVDLFVMRDEALKAMAEEVDGKNEPIRAEYERRIGSLRAQDLAPVEQHIADLRTSLDVVARNQAQAENERLAAFTESQAQDLEAERQDNGIGGRRHGHGDLAKDAERQREQARDRIQMAEAREQELAAQRTAFEREASSANDRLTAAREQFRRDAAALLKERDARLIRPTNGPMAVVLGWLRLQRDPETGTAVHLTTLVAWITMMTLELAFFLARVVFKGASIYDARINTRMRREAVRLAADFSAEVAETRRRPALRIVAENGPAPGAAANGGPAQPNINGE